MTIIEHTAIYDRLRFLVEWTQAYGPRAVTFTGTGAEPLSFLLTLQAE